MVHGTRDPGIGVHPKDQGVARETITFLQTLAQDACDEGDAPIQGYFCLDSIATHLIEDPKSLMNWLHMSLTTMAGHRSPPCKSFGVTMVYPAIETIPCFSEGLLQTNEIPQMRIADVFQKHIEVVVTA